MEYVQQHAPSVPVPEVYDSDFDDPYAGRIFMEEIPGDTLENVWPSLAPDQKEQACRELWDIIMTLRKIPRPPEIPPEKCLYTTVDGSPIYPQGGLTGNEAGPLREDLHNTDDAFRDFIVQRYRENWGPDENVIDNFPRSETAVFTHGDFKPKNIMASADGHITSILDFEYAGFMPDYWEDIGMFLEIWEWEEDWADTMLRTKPSSWDFDATRALCRVAKRVLHW
ncbi:putative phosphotransferase family protein [Diaporthe ampelina]|uniref:Putative phosphotransferase family protein n=1 Tax=Diaporthe ampelina TaxID=1214573 RepID=A0A0G2HVW4_9PEZI|nr:putative phosphotransferase family protein [Diaporthe ampelina]